MQGKNNLDPIEKLLKEKIEDKVEKARGNKTPQVTDFLDPYQQKLAESFLKPWDDLTYLIYGGYPSAERAKIAIMPRFWLEQSVDLNIKFLHVQASSKFNKVSHGDYLGAILSLGLKRDKVGDIIVEEQGATIVVDSLAVSFILSNLSQVKNIMVNVKEISSEEIKVQPEKTKELRGTVASLRLDALTSLGFGYSRSKIVKVIKADQVKLNWQRASDPSLQVKKGDVISLRGRGRIVIEDILGESRKGRIQVLVKKIL